ncbi:MAG: hypothetical protein M3P84_09425 [Chloroflexota bacterium]|nr:hypothetical protein [Chloroflexota bacterium]
MDPFLLVLRVLHIGAGVFWVGAAFAFFLFVSPSAKALGPDAHGAFMDQVVRRRFPMVVLVAGIVTVFAGALLYLRDSGGLSMAWISSPTGAGFTIGAAAAIVSLALGPLVILPSISSLQALGGRLKAEGRPPTPEEGATLDALDRRLTQVGQFDLVLLTVAVVMMATARYL